MHRIILAAAAAALLAAPAVAQEDRVEVGLLECVIEGGTGFVVGSSKDLRCTFDGVEEGRPIETYFGQVNKFGLDIGTTGTQVMQWAVFAPTSDPFGPGALAGDFTSPSTT